jgi:ABC-type uncharacterized transport system permease subunit
MTTTMTGWEIAVFVGVVVAITALHLWMVSRL